MGEQLVRLIGRALVKDATPAECAAMVKHGLSDHETAAEAVEGVFNALLED